MKAFLGLLIFYLVINVFLIALGTGIGFLLHWILPAVEIGMSILIGVVSSTLSLYVGIRMFSYFEDYAEEEQIIERLSAISPPPSRQQRQKRKSR